MTSFYEDLDVFSDLVGTKSFWERPVAQIEGLFRGLTFSYARHLTKHGDDPTANLGYQAAFHNFNARRRLVLSEKNSKRF